MLSVSKAEKTNFNRLSANLSTTIDVRRPNECSPFVVDWWRAFDGQVCRRLRSTQVAVCQLRTSPLRRVNISFVWARARNSPKGHVFIVAPSITSSFFRSFSSDRRPRVLHFDTSSFGAVGRLLFNFDRPSTTRPDDLVAGYFGSLSTGLANRRLAAPVALSVGGRCGFAVAVWRRMETSGPRSAAIGRLIARSAIGHRSRPVGGGEKVR